MFEGIPFADGDLNFGSSLLAESELLDGFESEAIKSNLERFLLMLTVSLSVATLPQVLRWARQVPCTLLLVMVGAALALVDVRLVNLSPELILTIEADTYAEYVRSGQLSRELAPFLQEVLRQT